MWRIYLYMGLTVLLEFVIMYLLWICNNEQAIIIIVLVPFIFLTSLFYAISIDMQKGIETKRNNSQ